VIELRPRSLARRPSQLGIAAITVFDAAKAV
jgi:hypothetical protein